jgi:hypothetical protein
MSGVIDISHSFAFRTRLALAGSDIANDKWRHPEVPPSARVYGVAAFGQTPEAGAIGVNPEAAPG